MSLRTFFAPRNARNVGAVRAPKPAGDSIVLFRPIILAAYKVACPDVLNVRSEIRTAGANTYVVVQCASGRPRAVRVVYTGATVPDLVGTSADGLRELGGLLELHIVESRRPRRGTERSNYIVHQRPRAGAVVPLGATLRVVVAT